MVTLLRYNQDTWFNKKPTVSVVLFDFLTKYIVLRIYPLEFFKFRKFGCHKKWK